MNCEKFVISLCDYSQKFLEPWKEAGYETLALDLKSGVDARIWEPDLKRKPHCVVGWPVCTHLAGSGARHWKAKGDEALVEAMSLVDACYRIIGVYKPKVWFLENPVGRLSRYLGKPTFTFNPNEYAGWLDNPDSEAYTKRTCLWGEFTPPKKKSVEPVHGSMMWAKYGEKSEKTKTERSKTPIGFSKAFFEANKI